MKNFKVLEYLDCRGCVFLDKVHTVQATDSENALDVCFEALKQDYIQEYGEDNETLDFFYKDNPRIAQVGEEASIVVVREHDSVYNLLDDLQANTDAIVKYVIDVIGYCSEGNFVY